MWVISRTKSRFDMWRNVHYDKRIGEKSVRVHGMQNRQHLITRTIGILFFS